jgi:hypothetical protein
MVLFTYQALPFWNIWNLKLVITIGFLETRKLGDMADDGGGRISVEFSKTSIASRVLLLILLSYCHLKWLLQNQRLFHCYKSSCCIYKGIRVTAI